MMDNLEILESRFYSSAGSKSMPEKPMHVLYIRVTVHNTVAAVGTLLSKNSEDILVPVSRIWISIQFAPCIRSRLRNADPDPAI